MNTLIHPLQIGTLATWLSVAAAGAVGLMWHHDRLVIPDHAAREITLALSDIVLGSEKPADATESDATASDDAPSEEFPAPPEMPAVSDAGPLPEVPELPVRPEVSPSGTARAATPVAPRQPRGSANPSSTRSTRSTRRNGGTGMSATARMAAGSMPAPSYPPEARSKGQAGTVVVEFTVDSSGKVISAFAKSPSPWPLLDQEAVRTVRRWKFPPGGVMKLQRPIVFQLR